jgi:hypothetical protein
VKRFSFGFVKLFVGNMESSIYVNNALLWLVCLKVGIVLWHFMEVSHIKCNSIFQMVYGIHGEVHLWPYANQALLWISVAENHNCLTTFNEILWHEPVIVNFIKITKNVHEVAYWRRYFQFQLEKPLQNLISGSTF